MSQHSLQSIVVGTKYCTAKVVVGHHIALHMCVFHKTMRIIINNAIVLCRFAGAIPEVANSRLAMLGVLAALGAEFATGLNVFEQFKAAPVPIVLTFFIFTLATAIPVFKGVPRKGNDFFSSNAELINGRVAMIGFLGIVISTFYTGHALFFL